MTKKPKSVDEAWVLECSPDGEFRPRAIHEEESALKDLDCPYKKLKPRHRIRKWKAVTVCEIIKENRCAFKTGCGEFLPWIINYCPYCGGKIKVRK